MIWYFRKNIFSYRTMSMVALHLKNRQRKQRSAFAETYPVRRIVKVDADLEQSFEDAFLRMDIKQTFSVNQLKNRLSQGHYLVIVEDSNKTIGWTWGGVGALYFDEFDCMLKISQKSGFSYNTYIDPSYRGKNLNQLSISVMADEMEKDGFNILWGLINYRNVRSIKSFSGFGFVDEGPFRCVKFLYMTFLKPPIKDF